MDGSISDEKLTAISQALFGARKIEAIKIYRASTGVGLYEAKQAVEAIEADLRATAPDKFSRAAGRGCLGITASLFGIGCVALWWFGSGRS